MKKILLTLSLVGAVLFGSAQTVLNEVYTEPGAGKSEFIELYNSSTVGSQETDCFTIITYWESGANTGWYVIDLPSGTIPSKGFYVIAAANPFNVQSQVNVVPDANWNSLPASGYLKKYQRSGGTYTEIAAGTVTDLLMDVSPTGASGHNYFTFLLQNGVPINAFWGGGPTGTLPTGITSMPNLDLTPASVACGSPTPFTVNFSTWGAVEFVNQAPGSDNGYARTSDGKCGAWAKTAPGVSHTPGVSNGNAGGLSGSLTTSQLIICSTPRQVNFDITAVSGSVTEADDFPVEIQVYKDSTNNGQLDGLDVFIGSKSQATVAQSYDSILLLGTRFHNANLILVYKTKRGCFDKIVAVQSQCAPLPVHFASFTAKRSNSSSVNLIWQTASELNNSGFEVQRNVNGNWETVIFIPTQATGGNSDALLTYYFTDMNSAKGMSQYRIKQIDFDGKSEFSVVRAVRGEGVSIKTVIYPNPSFDGRVNVVFEDASGIRDISLMDMSGRIVRTWTGVSNNNLTIDNLNPGMYSLRITVKETGAQTVEKLVVNKR